MATDKPNYPSDAAEKFIVRLPPGMREQIAEAAKSNNRSMNAEVVDRLQRTLEKWAPPPDQSTMNRLAEAIMEQQISTLRAQWSADRVRKEALRDRLDRMLESGASVEEIDAAERDLADAIAELDETERMGLDAREKLELIRNGKRHT